MLKNKRWDSPLLDPLSQLLRVWGYKTKTLNLNKKAKFELKTPNTMYVLTDPETCHYISKTNSTVPCKCLEKIEFAYSIDGEIRRHR